MKELVRVSKFELAVRHIGGLRVAAKHRAALISRKAICPHFSQGYPYADLRSSFQLRACNHLCSLVALTTHHATPHCANTPHIADPLPDTTHTQARTRTCISIYIYTNIIYNACIREYTCAHVRKRRTVTALRKHDHLITVPAPMLRNLRGCLLIPHRGLASAIAQICPRRCFSSACAAWTDMISGA